ncbi:class F sortase [Herbiconiux daphne]|uniref:Class F sortase n=1 Tax=Herbiconiux daphne TaxID=2970914 RepID=A0ABT2GVY3_9MICO|nr:class F sortase [Herbiconiux daphne]MCS5732126.1 class F sortase [Herbiconiux daphne]
MRTRRATAGATATPAVAPARAGIAAAAVLLAAPLLTGCAGPTDSATGTGGAGATSAAPTATAPTGSPTPEPTSTAPAASGLDVPRTNADLAAQPPQTVIEPVRVEVPSLGIDVAVTAEALADDGTLALPADPDVAAWYRYGPSPWSAAGATVIAAHVDSLEYGLGQFAQLASAPAGTLVVVTGDDASVAQFTTATVEVLQKTAVPWATVFDRTGAPRLTLVTCGGEFDYSTGHYLSNVIVTATATATPTG